MERLRERERERERLREVEEERERNRETEKGGGKERWKRGSPTLEWRVRQSVWSNLLETLGASLGVSRGNLLQGRPRPSQVYASPSALR